MFKKWEQSCTGKLDIILKKMFQILTCKQYFPKYSTKIIAKTALHKCNLRQRDFVALQKDILQSIYSGTELQIY